ncbi:MAG TPA: hypothetical protein VGF14_02725 [Alphaproteobacteria bacterium]
MALSQPHDDSNYDDISSPPVNTEISRPTKRRLNSTDAIQVPFDDETTIQMDLMRSQPADYTITVMFPGEHSPILETTSVNGKLAQPVMEFNGCTVVNGIVDEATGQTVFPDGIAVTQSDKNDAGAKVTQMVLHYKDTNYTIISRVEGDDYVAKIERTKDGVTESVRFAAVDQNPCVTYQKLQA